MGNMKLHEYATEGDTVCFEVNEEVFICDPKLFLASNHFEKLLDSCQGSILKPISLVVVTVDEFSLFASYLHDPETISTDDMEQWETIRRLSTLWKFDDLRRLALAKLMDAGAGPKSQNPFKEFNETMGERVNGMGEEPINGIANILGGIGTGLATGVGSAIILPFAIASLPFIGIHKGIKWASKGKEKE